MPAGDITQGYIFVPAEKSIDQAKMNAIVGQAYINPAFISAQTESTSTTTGDYFLLLKSGGTLAKIVLDNLANSLAATTGFQSQIWSTRLRSFNSVGNCNFEVAQRNCRTGLTNPAHGTPIEDRWFAGNTGSLNPLFQGLAIAGAPLSLPGTNFGITSAFMRILINTSKASLAATDLLYLFQQVEGPMWRELSNDVHSVSILCRSSVANLKFGLSLRDGGTTTKTLTKLCTLGAANTITLITLPNLPVFPSGNFTTTPGSPAYLLGISLAIGSTYINSANDIWTSGNLPGAVGQDNFLSNAVNSTFEVFYVQHEPGSQCTTLQDKPFSQSLDEALRYYYKTYRYAIKPGNASDQNGAPIARATKIADTQVYGWFPFAKVMAKTPTIVGYSTASGTANTVRDLSNGADRVIGTTGWGAGETGFEGFAINGPAGSGLPDYAFHYTADTGW
jgi:hypothetical protein